MKKNYICPALQVLETTTFEMLAVSIKVGGAVDKSEDVGFVKGENHNEESGEFWKSDMDW